MEHFKMQSCHNSISGENVLQLDQGELDYECDLILKNKDETETECLDRLSRFMYKCGACDKEFDHICKLHNHLQDHIAGGSYHYDHVCRTAVPKFDTCCAYTQTELIKDEPRNNLETNATTDPEENPRRTRSTSSFGIRKTRGRPKGSKNVFNKRRKLINAYTVRQTGDSSQAAKEETADTQDIKHENESIDNDYNDDTDVEFEFIEFKSETNRDNSKAKDLLITENGMKEESSFDSTHTLIKDKIKKFKDTENEMETDTSNAINDARKDSVEVKSELCKGDEDTVYYSPIETKMHKNKRKMVQPRKVLKQDGKNKFKNKTLFKSHARSRKKHSQLMKPVQMKQGFTKVEEDISETVDQSNKKSEESEQSRCNKTKAMKSNLFKCGLCNMTLSRYKMLRHDCEKDKVKTKDGVKKTKILNCEFCGFPFLRSEYTAHLRTHTGERPFICEKCGKDFARIKYLKKHLITHEEVKPFICSICGAGFCQNKEYKQHMCSHTGEREHVCNVCDSTFICKASLLTHVQNIHLGETRFECDVCLRRFFKRSSLNLHRATHFEAALNCQFCAKRFKDSTGLKRHEKIHTGVKNFKCHLCEHAFVQSTPFWSHMEKRHALSKDEAKKVHKENVQKAKVMKHVMKNQTAKSEPATKPVPILQQPLLYNTNAANVDNALEDYELGSKGSGPLNLNHQHGTELTHHNLTNVDHQASVTQDSADFVETVNYHHTVDVSKYTTVPQSIHYNDKTDFSEYTQMNDISGSNSMHKTISEVDTLPTSSQFENVVEHVQKYANKQEDSTHVYDVEMFEKVSSDLRDYSRYQYDIVKRDEHYTSLYDPLNYEKVHDLSNPEPKVTKSEEGRYEESAVKERNISPEEPYSVLVKVPDPSLYTWNKKDGHYEKIPEVTQSHTINVADLDQYKPFDKTSEIHGLKMSDLLPVDRPQDLSCLGIAYQNYLNSAQGQGYLDRLMIQSHYEKLSSEFDKVTGQISYSSVPARLTQEAEQVQVEMTRVQSPYEDMQDQSNVSM